MAPTSTLSRAIWRARRSATAVLDGVRTPPHVRPGHYYSPLTSDDDVTRAIENRRSPTAVDVRESEQLAFARRMNLRAPAPGRRRPGNEMFETGDAAIFRGILLSERPRRIVEIGSGYSTALALDVADEELGELRVTCVEPYADRLRSVLRDVDHGRLTLIERPVQELHPGTLVEPLESGDIFFIDSPHVAKAGSDVLWLMLHVLPLVKPGVLVHVHDIWWPFDYPAKWLRQHRDWTEAYLLHALLAENPRWRVELFANWLTTQHPESAPHLVEYDPGSFWMRRC